VGPYSWSSPMIERSMVMVDAVPVRRKRRRVAAWVFAKSCSTRVGLDVCNCIFVTNHVLAWKGTCSLKVEGKECVRAGVPPRSKLGVRRQPNREAPQAR
jgi:hypothetical protein